jgi:predicted nucleotidyltransferase
VLDVLRDHAARVYLFGSSATGEARRASDIDVAIDATDALPSRVLSDLRERLEESAIPFDIDVIDLRRATPEIRASVEREAVVWRG